MQSNWSRKTVAGKAVDWFDPPAKPRFALLYLHSVGCESLAENAVYSDELRRLNLACCAPQGDECWWADRICPAFDASITPMAHLLANVLPAMLERWSLPPKRVAVAGISMGGQGALRLGFQHPDKFGVVAGVSSALDVHERYGLGSPLDALYRSREACRQDTAILHVDADAYPKRIWFACDPGDAEWFRGNDRLAEKLSAIGIPHTADLVTEAGGHSWAYFEAMAAPMLEYVARGLEAESRRLM